MACVECVFSTAKTYYGKKVNAVASLVSLASLDCVSTKVSLLLTLQS